MTYLPGTQARRRIYLMRHGHVDYFQAHKFGGTDFVPLTERGEGEAKAAGQALSHIEFDMAVCSGLRRTRETASLVLAQQAGTAPELTENEGVREVRGGGGSLRGQPLTTTQIAQAIYEAFVHAAEPGARMGEDGEVFAEAYARVIATIEGYLFEPDWATALIVAHEGVNRLILGWATGAGLSAASPFEQDTGCINVIDVDLDHDTDGQDGSHIERRIIKAVNLTPYNYLKHGMNLTSLEAIFSRP